MSAELLPPRGLRPAAALAAALRARQAEIETATLARIYGVADPAGTEDHEYVSGLRSAVSAALRHGIAGIEGRAERPPPLPPQLLGQARLAARQGVPLETVLRRYFAGYILLGGFAMETAQSEGIALGPVELDRIWRSEAALFDRLIAAIAHEHGQESAGGSQTPEQRRADQVRRLLDGELLDASELRYELEGWHLGALATGPGAHGALRALGATLARNRLIVPAQGETVWAWWGTEHRLDPEDLLRQAQDACAEGIHIALGEPARGMEGWRLTHRQARAALAVAARRESTVVRYDDVALLASALRDEVLAVSLQRAYLAPLESERDGGQTLRRTLRAYLAARGNASSAAAALGVTWPTVKSHLRTIEERISRPLDSCIAELETALQLRELQRDPQREASSF